MVTGVNGGPFSLRESSLAWESASGFGIDFSLLEDVRGVVGIRQVMGTSECT